MSLELVKQFQDEAYSIAIHPNGLLAVVGFADKLRLMAVLLDDLKVRIPSRCKPAAMYPTSFSLLQACQPFALDSHALTVNERSWSNTVANRDDALWIFFGSLEGITVPIDGLR
jgi:hypothetical protein